MNGYSIMYEGSIEEQTKGIDRAILGRIQRKIEEMALKASGMKHQALKGKEYRHHYKLRVGDFRVVYLISHSDRLITVRQILHRSKIYKER